MSASLHRMLVPTMCLLGFALVACTSFRDTAPGEANNVLVSGDFAYVALGANGLGIFALPDGALIETVPPAAGSGSVDDIAIADGLLFALDAAEPGALSVWSLADARSPALAQAPVPVPVEPFTGVSAARGRVVVSGGTSELTVRSYDARGRLGGDAAAFDLGRGQPDVLVAPDGQHAFVSTHFSLLRFEYGVTVFALGEPPAASRAVGKVVLGGAGFTGGGAKPANFPIESALAGDTLLIAHGDGLAFVDVSDRAAPKLLTILPLGFEAVSVDALSDHAAVVGAKPTPTAALVQFGNASAPVIVKSSALPAESYPTGVALTADAIVIAAHEAGLLILPR